ncbi:MAG: hypothetical protein IT430_09915 [Phycisphaerales bacterium]|nr:hypothetical protein [Phycisphaerales bacterium]
MSHLAVSVAPLREKPGQGTRAMCCALWCCHFGSQNATLIVPLRLNDRSIGRSEEQRAMQNPVVIASLLGPLVDQHAAPGVILRIRIRRRHVLEEFA